MTRTADETAGDTRTLFARLCGVPAARRLWAGVVAALGAISMCSVASAAPTGEYAVFADCPLSNPVTFACVYSQITGGEMRIGRTTVPIENKIMLQGGLLETFENAGGGVLIPAADGDTLSRAPQPVPGGLLGIVAPAGLPRGLRESFDSYVASGSTDLAGTVELVGPPSLEFIEFIEERGTAVSLPIRVKLENAFLGGNCYIGSRSDPIKLEMTTGTSLTSTGKAIVGAHGVYSANAASTIPSFRGFSMVDGSFSIPGASGCGAPYSTVVDQAVDAKIGLPSSASSSTAILKGNLSLVNAKIAGAS